MNIKELMEWRQYCFFCNDELAIVPEIKVDAKFFIENNYFVIESRFVNLSIHVETGEIIIPNLLELEKDKIMVDEFFLQRFDFKIVCKCLSCVEIYDKKYQYYGSMLLDSSVKNADVSLLTETFSSNNWAITQQKDRDLPWESILYLKKGIDKYSLKDKINISFLDLKKLTPEKIENKIKTYVVFS